MKMLSNRIGVICYNVVKGGGVSVVFSMLEFLLEREKEVAVLCPDIKVYRQFFANHKASTIGWRIHYFPLKLNFIFFKPLINYLILPFYVWYTGCKYICNLGNVAFPSGQKHFLLMHNAFAVSDDELLLQRFSKKERMRQKLMNRFILYNLRFASKIAVQTNTIKIQLSNRTGVNATVIPNISIAQSLSKIEIVTPEFNGERINLLFLSKYYVHKNFESLVYLADIIKDKQLRIRFSITFAGNDADELLFLKKIQNAGVTDIIRNIGFVESGDLMSVYLAHDALFLPTLMESYSGTYTEAMRFKRPIFTSDRDFAREVCGEGALYFDPYHYNEIIETIEKAFSNPPKLQEMVNDNYNKIMNNSVNNSPMSEMMYNLLLQ